MMRPDADDPVQLRPAERAARTYVLAVVMPLWIASGSVDYVLHRRSRIEATSGSYEAKLHAFGIGLSALPVLAGLLLEINAGVIALLGAGYVAHLGMTIWDVAYADRRRAIVPVEQHVHGLLELLPFTALSIVLCTYPDQALALVGRGNARPAFAFGFKRVPLPRRAVAAIVGAFGLLVALPYAEELRRCLRYERRVQPPAAGSVGAASGAAEAAPGELESLDAASP